MHGDYTTSIAINQQLDVNSNENSEMLLQDSIMIQQEEEYKPIGYEDEWVDEVENVSNQEDLIFDEEVDDFPDYKFDVLWQQKCWDILCKLYFDVDSAAFLCDISAEAMGQEFYNDYVSTI